MRSVHKKYKYSTNIFHANEEVINNLSKMVIIRMLPTLSEPFFYDARDFFFAQVLQQLLLLQVRQYPLLNDESPGPVSSCRADRL